MIDATRSRPTRIAVIGVGSMGKGLAYQASVTRDMHCVGLADIDLRRALACADFLGRPYRVVHSADDASVAIRDSKLALCEDGRLLCACDDVDVLLETSSSVPAGGLHAELAITRGKHVVMMNAEADQMFGPYLMLLAREHGVVYTSADGDQPCVLRHLVDELESWGFELVMAGNMKGFLDRYANPTSIADEARKRDYTPKMTAGYTDGSKLCVEMSLVANAMGLSTPVAGMVGPRVDHVQRVLDHFDFDAIHRSGPVVDYVLGAQPDGGVFAVGHCDNSYQRSMLSTLKMGTGPFYVFYRPYHLCHVEAIAAVRDVMRGRPLLQPIHGFRTNVFAYAKKDLRAGERLDGFGGYMCYGLIENCDPAGAMSGLPLGLAEDVTLARDIRKDERLAWADVRHDSTDPAFTMFAKALDASRSLAGARDFGSILRAVPAAERAGV